ncbi:hypothetical protein ACIO52_21185 [Nocardia sp. NPDC087230]|uniref:hypothetical protein n=1 Tax=Nocardia sp. NPDC087230 TaxID=3364331 RepID=UPI00382357D5
MADPGVRVRHSGVRRRFRSGPEQADIGVEQRHLLGEAAFVDRIADAVEQIRTRDEQQAAARGVGGDRSAGGGTADSRP